MRIWLLHLWNRLTSTYWFVPAVIMAVAFGVAMLTLQLDRKISHKFEDTAMIFSGGAQGARSLLAAVAGSVITVASLVFSITIATLTQASQQFGPRLLRNFMRSTPNQVVLGVFVATFLYCLLVLRTIRAEEGESAVPQISVTVALILALASMMVLIYFVHVMARSLQAPVIIGNVASELRESIDELYPEEIGVPADRDREASDFAQRVRRDGTLVRSSGSGYVQVINSQTLLENLKKKDMRAEMLCRPGHFVSDGQPVAWVSPRERCDDAACDVINGSVLMGRERTEEQDIEYAIHQIVEIAVRALSPGVNDPFTAINCLDQLGDALSRLCRRAFPSQLRADESGEVRLLTYATSFRGICDSMFNMIRQNCAGSVAVSIRFLDTLNSVLASAPDMPAERRAIILHHARLMYEAATARDSLSEADRETIERRFKPMADAEAGEVVRDEALPIPVSRRDGLR